MDANTNTNTNTNINMNIFGAMSSTQIHVEPLVFANDDLFSFALQMHTINQTPTSLTWAQLDYDNFDAMMLESPTGSRIKTEPPASPLRIGVPANATIINNANITTGRPRRSARIAGSASFVGTASAVGITSGEDNDEDEEDEGDDNDPATADKVARRRDQLRKASLRRRTKLKAEAEFLHKRNEELESHMAILHRRFPQLVPPPLAVPHT